MGRKRDHDAASPGALARDESFPITLAETSATTEMRAAPARSVLLASSAFLDEPAIVGVGQAWTWRQVHRASMELSTRFASGSTVCNLCTSRLGFLVTWIAALRSDALLVLPPSRGHADLASVLESTPDPIVVVDDSCAIHPSWRSIAECLVCPTVRPSPVTRDDDLGWRPDWDRAAVLLYTSGSTGSPEPQPKTLLQLAVGAKVLGERLEREVAGGLRAIRRIVCSVPPQHMFGVEASVMLSLVHAIPVYEARPMLPADVQQALRSSPSTLWVSTPLHLRALVQSGEALSNCKGVVSSTMPLTRQLAGQAEAIAGAPVIEIYGSTETGVLATRRTASEASWSPVSGVHLESVKDGTLAHGAHFTSPVRLSDETEIDETGAFMLVGRSIDMIKIGGRRASLSGLNALLDEMPGLDDGVFYLPATDNMTERLCLIYSGRELDRGAVEAWLRPRLDSAFLPRAIIHVDRLPRSDSGKLPRQALDRLFATWQRRINGRAIPPRQPMQAHRFEFQFSIDTAHPALPGHFPGRPIVPGVLLLHRVMAGAMTELARPVPTVRSVKFTAALLPAETATVHCESIGDTVQFSVRTTRGGKVLTLAIGSLRLAPHSARPIDESMAEGRGTPA